MKDSSGSDTFSFIKTKNLRPPKLSRNGENDNNSLTRLYRGGYTDDKLSRRRSQSYNS